MQDPEHLADLGSFVWEEGDYFYADSGTTSKPKWQHPERQAIATEILKGMVSSGLMESPQDMAKEAVGLADALLEELNK